MQMDSYHLLQYVYNESKFWLAFGGALWSAFKAITWVKSIKTNDLHHIQGSLDSLHGELGQQTDAIVNELRELRQDIRTFYPRPRSSKRQKAK